MTDFLNGPVTDEQQDLFDEQDEQEREADATRLGLSVDATLSEIYAERRKRRIRKLGLDPETATQLDIERAAMRLDISIEERGAWDEWDEDDI